MLTAPKGADAQVGRAQLRDRGVLRWHTMGVKEEANLPESVLCVSSGICEAELKQRALARRACQRASDAGGDGEEL